MIETLKVKNIIISKQTEISENYIKFKRIIKNKKTKLIVVEKGNKIAIENDVYFDILWPNTLNLINENPLNNNSIVCKLNYKNFSALFTGDIEEIAEKQMLKEFRGKENYFNSTVLKVAHHGSKSSSINDFIEAVKPTIALIGVGENNKFGHPNEGVLERLKKVRNQNF